MSSAPTTGAVEIGGVAGREQDGAGDLRLPGLPAGHVLVGDRFAPAAGFARIPGLSRLRFAALKVGRGTRFL